LLDKEDDVIIPLQNMKIIFINHFTGKEVVNSFRNRILLKRALNYGIDARKQDIP
jgi:hypothetical protein